jgi:acyl dehydratase
MPGLYYEDAAPGTLIDHQLTRTVTESDNVTFCAMTHNPQPLHLDAEYARKTEFGRRLVNSMFTASLAVGVSVQDTTLGTLVANLGYREMNFPRPVFHGDTLRVQTEVTERRESNSRPNAGIVTFEHRVHNQHGDLVCRLTRVAMLQKRPSS